MAISASEVKKLRDRTGLGMMDCKKALEEAGGDMSKAEDLLRKQGLKAAEMRPTDLSGKETSHEPQILFFHDSGEPHPSVPLALRDESFARFGWMRMKTKNLKK